MRYFLLLFVALTGCRTLKDSPKYKFSDGIYHTRTDGEEKGLVYVENTEDSVVIYSIKKGWQAKNPDRSALVRKSLPHTSSRKDIQTNRYWQNGFDIDIVTVPFKFRPSRTSFPRQLSNHLNGALYLGYRNDTYELAYKKNPIGNTDQSITHLGFSAGIITGLGTTPMNSWVTNNQLSIEYDGFVWSKGAAVIVGVDKITFGIMAGIDHLLDENRALWLYQGKPYAGFVVGLNLN
ncbi:hypothetical protein [Dyadobacter sandarakinus]|uniref:Lipoprotein n=1 Tax=Dyadobacter sandarakinus TaxID=2747268 RepID=A0ABX7I3Y5_9BACT|nr:hypothetical protein [Dyadobacter sandarakinus]QRR00635.1 hypothetical protein HWI92_06790 [Dyadobacter sandarakinus]